MIDEKRIKKMLLDMREQCKMSELCFMGCPYQEICCPYAPFLWNDKEIEKMADGWYDLLNEDVIRMPTADAQEMKNAHWIVDNEEGLVCCSSCHNEFEDNGYTIPDYWYYCPTCGAKMDETEEEK